METMYKSYIPPVLDGTKEFKALDQTVNAYFNGKLWPEVSQQFDNQYIETSDEKGIAYYEKLCGLTPAEGDTLESRRALVLAKWIDQLPYNYGALLRKLDAICGAGEYEIFPYFERATIGLYTHSVKNIEAVERMIRDVVPCNIVLEIHNELSETFNKNLYTVGYVKSFKSVYLSTVDTSAQTINSQLSLGSSVTKNKHLTIGG